MLKTMPWHKYLYESYFTLQLWKLNDFLKLTAALKNIKLIVLNRKSLCKLLWRNNLQLTTYVDLNYNSFLEILELSTVIYSIKELF